MFLAVPATSASSERVFSGAGFLFSERRRGMASESLASLVFIRENADASVFKSALDEMLNKKL